MSSLDAWLVAMSRSSFVVHELFLPSLCTNVSLVVPTNYILKKFDMGEAKPLSKPMSTTMALDANEDGEPVD
jgi:hypothetical protein